jgi:hypothetical protein
MEQPSCYLRASFHSFQTPTKEIPTTFDPLEYSKEETNGSTTIMPIGWIDRAKQGQMKWMIFDARWRKRRQNERAIELKRERKSSKKSNVETRNNLLHVAVANQDLLILGCVPNSKDGFPRATSSSAGDPFFFKKNRDENCFAALDWTASADDGIRKLESKDSLR